MSAVFDKNLKARVQSYAEFTSWKKRALPFLRKQEGWNNIFWQIMRIRERTSGNGWLGNVFVGGKTGLCAMHTPSGYLLLSHGSIDAVDALANHSLLRLWKLNGVSGPEFVVHRFLKGAKLLNSDKASTRAFKLFQTRPRKKAAIREDFRLVKASSVDWQRARIWAQLFALEADPPMDVASITKMAKQMHDSKNLFILKDERSLPCAMAGFGRSTDRYLVINMVFVPKEKRGFGLGAELIIRMTALAKQKGYEECLLFSDWKEARNLYDSLGFVKLGRFVECDLV